MAKGLTMLHRTPCSLHGRRWASLRPLCRHRPRHRHHQPLESSKAFALGRRHPEGSGRPTCRGHRHRLHRTLPIAIIACIAPYLSWITTSSSPSWLSRGPPWLSRGPHHHCPHGSSTTAIRHEKVECQKRSKGHPTRKSRMPEAIQRSSDAEKSNARSDPNAIRQSSKPIHHAAAHHTLGIGRAIDREEYGTSPYRCLTVRTIDQNGIRYATVKAV